MGMHHVTIVVGTFRTKMESKMETLFSPFLVPGPTEEYGQVYKNSVQRALQRADSTNQLRCWSHEGSCIHVTYVQYVMHLFIHIHVYIYI